jgi:hypothetical protein
MSLLEYPKKRLAAFREEIARVKSSDFPYPQSKEALAAIQTELDRLLKAINTLTPSSDKETIRSARVATVTALNRYVPFLGFILRSTNVRNAFEVYGPLLRLSQRILGEQTRLVLSSEWDYSPYTYFGCPILSDFVFIGLPAPESGNPLLLPLAGHELAHSVWARNSYTAEFAPEIDDDILGQIKGPQWDQYIHFHPGAEAETLDQDLVAKQTWAPSALWALAQAEETFCDFVGLRLFGESYLYAFAYLFSPNEGGYRSVVYPNMCRRVND